MINRTIGSIFVASGTAIGAGMLALPLVTAGMGYAWAAVTFLAVWAIMYVSALLTLEVNLAFKAPNNHYGTMARATLGRPGQWATSISYLLLLYALTSAYIAGGASLLQAASLLLFNHTLPDWANAIGFTLILGSIVSLSTRAVDYTNRGLFSIKILLLIGVFALFLPRIDYLSLLAQHEALFIPVAIPVILTAFGFHIVIPSLAPYLDENPVKLKKVLFFGSLLPLVIYLVWLGALLGTLPYTGANSFAALATSGGSVGELMIAVNRIHQLPWLNTVLNLFAHLAVITSFLGVSLSLFDFCQDKQDKTPHRLKTSLITFIPPLLVALFYPNGFVQLLSYASIFVAVILIILPAIMAYRLRRMHHIPTSYHTPGGNITICFVILAGLGFIVVEVMRIMECLPVWKG